MKYPRESEDTDKKSDRREPGNRGEPHEDANRLERVWLFVKRRWVLILLVAIMAAALAVRLFYFTRHTIYTTDSYYFLMLAKSLRSGLEYTVRGFTHYKYFPGYPLLVAGFSFIFRDYAWTAAIVAALGGTFSLLYTYLIGRELMNDLAGLMAAAILAFHPTFLQFTSFPMTEGVFTFFLTAGLYYFLSGCTRGSYYRRIGGAALGGLALFTRVEGILFVPLALLILLLYWKDARLKLWEIPVVLALYAVPLGAYLARNLISAGKITTYLDEYSSSEGVSFSLIMSRAKYMAWTTFYDRILFYLGAILALFRKYKLFLILFGWFFLFSLFHVFWYYAHPRFMVPAIPAVALLVAYLLYEVGSMGWKGLREGGNIREWLADRFARRRPKLAGRVATVLTYSLVVVVAGLFVYTFTANVVNADKEVTLQYKTMSGDMGGKAIAYAADFIGENREPGDRVAVNVGPYFAYEYGDFVYYVQKVPVGCPFEDADLEPPNLVEKMTDRGIRYLVISQAIGGADTLDLPGVPTEIRQELALIGIEPDELPRLKLLRVWHEYYEYPTPRDWVVAVFEIMPEGAESKDR